MIHAINYWAMEHGMDGNHPIDQALAQAKAAGFDGLELCISGPADDAVLHLESTQADCEAIRKQIDASGMVVETLASGLTWGCSPTSNDPSVREQAIEQHARALERAGWLGCQAMLMVPGIVGCPFVPDEKVRYNAAIERCRAAIDLLLPVAKKANVVLCLENVWNGMLLSPNEWCELIDSYNDEHLKIYFDVGNVLGYHQHPAHWIDTLGDRIGRVHVKDFKHEFGWSGKYAFCDLGQGDVPWPDVMTALKNIGYNKTLVAEMLPWKEGIVENTAAAMKKLCQ